MTDDEVAQAVERAEVVLSGVEGPCSQGRPHVQLARDVVALAETLRILRLMYDEAE